MRILLFTILLVLAGCNSRPTSVPMIDGMVDNFEDGNRYSELSYEWQSVSGGGETNASIFIEPGGVGSSIYQLTVGGMRPFGSSGDQVSGARIALGNTSDSGSKTATDVTAYTGLSIAMSGTPGSYIIQLGTASVTDHDYYNSYVEVTEQWNVFNIPFDRFLQEGFGTKRDWTGEDVTHIAIYSNTLGPYQLNVDDVAFYTE